MRIRWVIAMFAVALAVTTTANAATVIGDPLTFVRQQYDKIVRDRNYATPDDIYSDRLKALMALDAKEAGKGNVGRFDFDIWIDAQDATLTDVTIKALPVESAPNRKIVVATFKNFGKPHEVHFYFERGTNGWRLDDARATAPEQWTLSLILKYGWDGKD